MIKNMGFMVFVLKLAPIFLKFVKSVKMIKIALGAGSMLAYSYLFTWQFAFILILSIVFHEYGHITGMKNRGMKTKGIFLIPFVGGAAVPEGNFKNRGDETYVSLMGPYYGLLLAIPFLAYGIIYESALSIGLVSFMALINLFNLLPINPLDGGRVLKSIAFSLNTKLGLIVLFGGILAGIGIVYYYKIWLLLFVLVIGAIELFFEYLDYKKVKGTENFHLIDEKRMNNGEMIKYSLYYVTLIIAFVGLIFYTGKYEGADLALKVLTDKV